MPSSPTVPRRALALLLALAPRTAWAGAWHVPGDADTIAEALLLASEWQTIYVDAATYGGEPPVSVDFPIYILSTDGDPVAYPSFSVFGGTLGLSGGTVGTAEMGDVSPEGMRVTETAAILVVDGAVTLHDVEVDATGGYGVYALDSVVQLDNVGIANASGGAGLKFAAYDDQPNLLVENSRFTSNAATALWAYNVDPAANWLLVEISGTTFSGNSTAEYGGDLRLTGVDETDISGGSFSGATAGTAGGSIYAYNSPLSIADDTLFSGNTAPNGGSIAALGDTSDAALTITSARFTGGRASGATGYGGEIATSGVRVSLTDVASSGAEAVYGAFLHATGSRVTVRDSEVRTATADMGAALYFSDVEEATVRGTTLCGNAATNGPAVFGYQSAVTLDANVLQLNTSTSGGVVQATESALTIRDQTFVANTGASSAVSLAASEATILNNLFSGSPTGVALGGGSTVTEAGYNLYYALDVVDSGYGTLGGDVYEDPQFVATFDPTQCGTEPWLRAGSPAADAGDPRLTDADGSPSDIGAYPVEGAGEPDTGDTGGDTGDGEDTGGETGGPGDVPDADGDGTPDDADCAPDDASIHPGATDDPFDDVDQDCDGSAATGTARGGCGGCDASGGAGGLAILGALAATLRRKRA